MRMHITNSLVEGVMVAPKDYNKETHPNIETPNLFVRSPPYCNEDLRSGKSRTEYI